MIFTLIRDPVIRISGSESFTPGQLYASGLRVGYTCEDEDRNLENGKEAKIYGRTAIPRGTYPLEVSYSHRFHKLLPAVLDVPGYAGIRIHGGNRAEDSRGCILVGSVWSVLGLPGVRVRC